MMKRAWFALILSLTWLPYVSAEEPVYFADANLKAAVEEELWLTNPTPTDMLRLTSLRANDRGISSLSGLEYATNLDTVELTFNKISSISPRQV